MAYKYTVTATATTPENTEYTERKTFFKYREAREFINELQETEIFDTITLEAE